jgi:hypothetical protein
MPEQARRCFVRLWKAGAGPVPSGPVYVSMNDYLVTRWPDIPRVALAGLRFRRDWPQADGALALWVASTPSGRRQISVSIWRDPDDLRRFVRSPAHLKVMRDFHHAGELYTTPWMAERFEPALIWRQAEERLLGRVPGVRHHKPTVGLPRLSAHLSRAQSPIRQRNSE